MSFLSISEEVKNDCTTKNLMGVAEQLAYEFNVAELMSAAESNNQIIRKYTKLHRILKKLCRDGHITRSIAESVDRQLKGRVSESMNMAGFTTDPSQVGLRKVKDLLSKRIVQMARGSACIDNYETILDYVSKDRMEKAVRMLELIGARMEADRQFKTIHQSVRDIISNTLSDIGVDSEFYSKLSDEGIIDLLGHRETRHKFRSDVQRLRTNAKKNLKVLTDGKALEIEILTTGSDLKIIRAFSRLCSNMVKIIPEL